jgi:hypothetical protein
MDCYLLIHGTDGRGSRFNQGIEIMDSPAVTVDWLEGPRANECCIASFIRLSDARQSYYVQGLIAHAGYFAATTVLRSDKGNKKFEPTLSIQVRSLATGVLVSWEYTAGPGGCGKWFP